MRALSRRLPLLLAVVMALGAASCSDPIRTAERVLEGSIGPYDALMTYAETNPAFTAAHLTALTHIRADFPKAYRTLNAAVLEAKQAVAAGQPAPGVIVEQAALQALVDEITSLLPSNAVPTPKSTQGLLASHRRTELAALKMPRLLMCTHCHFLTQDGTSDVRQGQRG